MSQLFLGFSLIFVSFICLAGCSRSGRSEVDASSTYSTTATLFGLDKRLKEPFGIAPHADSVYVSDGEAGSIIRIEKDGTVKTIATGLNTPSAIAFLPDGDLVVADTGSHTIKHVSENGTVKIVAGVENVSGSADGDANFATFNGPIGIAVNEKDGSIYVADTYNDRIRLIKEGKVSTLAGSSRGFANGNSSDAKFDTPLGVAFWEDRLLVADSENRRIRVVESNGDVWTLAGSGDESLTDGLPSAASFVNPTSITTHAGRVFVADGDAIRVIGRRALPFVETISNERRGYVDGDSRHSRFNRPSGLAVGSAGELLVADSDNRAVRVVSNGGFGRTVRKDEVDSYRITAPEFRDLQPARWPYDPPMNAREVAGTLGEIRGEISSAKTPVWFHNGLDIAGAYGETAKFIRTEIVLDPQSAQNFGTSRELLRLPTIGYIHVRLGRDPDNTPLGDDRFQFERDGAGKLKNVRVARGTKFNAGDILGTLNSMNHVHLIAGRGGAEMNALDAMTFPGISDSIPPVIERIVLATEDWLDAPTSEARIPAGERRRIIVEAYDRMDGNAERRRLGVYRLGYQVLSSDGPLMGIDWSIVFDRMPSNEAVSFVYAPGSRSGATGVTKFRYVVSNRVGNDGFSEGFFDSAKFNPGFYTIRAYASDYFGNTSTKDLKFEISR